VNYEILLNTALSNPLMTIGLTGGVLMSGYVATQWWAVMSRHRFEKKRNRLELAALGKKIEALNLKAEAAPEAAWNGYRKFSVARKVEECEDTYSFYLTPHNGRPLPSFKPGQYLTFELQPPGAAKPLVRCYSLSDGALSNDHYRVTIKRFIKSDGAPGVVSHYFCDQVKEGDILNVKAPGGKFFLDVEVDRPVVLISGGIGITPMLAMARYLTHLKDPREIYFFFGCRSSTDHMLRDEVIELQKSNPSMRLHICYSRPLESDVEGVHFNHQGRVTIELMKEVLPSSNFEYYLCGPGPFMDSLVNGLYEWGVPKKDVKFEAFGPATVKSAPKEATADTADKPVIQIEFSRAGKTLPWDPEAANLHEFAEKHGVAIDKSCGAGSCGSCAVAIKKGSVLYDLEPSFEVEEGSCLTCICRPAGNLVIDA
jgi:ferredoxin-NADP reductase